MGATRRAYNWEWQLPSTPNCAPKYITRSVCWFAGKSCVRTHVLVEPAGSGRTRGRYGTIARFALAKCAMARGLHLQGCACGHGGGAWIALPATIHYSVVKSSDCPPRIGRKLFGRTISAVGAWARRMRIDGLTCSLVWRTITESWESVRRTSRRSLGFNVNGRKRASKVIVHTRAELKRTIAPSFGQTAGS